MSETTTEKNPKTEYQRRKQNGHIRTAIGVATSAVCFFAFPAVWSTAFAGIKYIATQYGNGLPLVWNPFLYALVAVLVLTVVFGRFFCGYACSFGTYGDVLYWLAARVRLFFRKRVLKKKGNRLPALPKRVGNAFRFVKYVLLIAILILCFTGHDGIITENSPWMVFSMFQKLSLPAEAGIVSIVFFVLISIGMLFEPRFFCRFLCPLGAVFSVLPVLPFATIRRDRKSCAKGCSLCEQSCPARLELPDRPDEGYSHLMGECYQCGRCVNACPKGSAKSPLVPGNTGGIVIQVICCLILIGVCWYLTNHLI